MGDHKRRLDRLVPRYRRCPQPDGPACPRRLVVVDRGDDPPAPIAPDTCPACGRPVRLVVRRYVVVGGEAA